MNSKYMKISLLLISGSVMFLAGCGPQDPNDPEFIAANAEVSINEANGGGCPTGNCPNAQGPRAQGPQGPQGAQGGCPTGNCEVPPDPDTDKAVQLPDQSESTPTKVVPTGEKQLATDRVFYRTNRHIYHHTQRQHTVSKHRLNANTYQQTDIHHPSFSRVNRVVRTFSQQNQTLPTIVTSVPPVDQGCSDYVEPQPAPQPVVAVPVSPCAGFGG